MAQIPVDQVSAAIEQYSGRATTYDASSGGWHAELADDFVSLVGPRMCDAVLDLACGTGLVTLRMAEKVVGSDTDKNNGVVVGVDVTPSMLDVARDKLRSLSAPAISSLSSRRIELVEADIVSLHLLEIDAIKRVLDTRGGFDIVSLCSALVLLENPAVAVKFWAERLLRPGGRLILDTPTEDQTVQAIATELVGKDVPIGYPYTRSWITSQRDVEDLLTAAGLEIVQTVRTKSFLPEKLYRRDQGKEVFETEVLQTYGRKYVETDQVEKAREAWLKRWADAVGEDGMLRSGHWLYVCVGRKT